MRRAPRVAWAQLCRSPRAAQQMCASSRGWAPGVVHGGSPAALGQAIRVPRRMRFLRRCVPPCQGGGWVEKDRGTRRKRAGQQQRRRQWRAHHQREKGPNGNPGHTLPAPWVHRATPPPHHHHHHPAPSRGHPHTSARVANSTLLGRRPLLEEGAGPPGPRHPPLPSSRRPPKPPLHAALSRAAPLTRPSAPRSPA